MPDSKSAHQTLRGAISVQVRSSDQSPAQPAPPRTYTAPSHTRHIPKSTAGGPGGTEDGIGPDLS